jgi:hypothetical protein
VSSTGRSAANLAVLLFLVLGGAWLWSLHAQAWDLGRRSPILNYDTAQYALAARELADHGRLATTFALPIELTHPGPPWALAVVQPGMVLAEAAVFRLVPRIIRFGDVVLYMRVPQQREWFTLFIPACCFLAIGVLLALIAARLLARFAPGTSPSDRRLAALTVGLAFILDPEAQHFAVGGFTELPFTFGLLGALATLVSDRAPLKPLLFGLLLGITGSFRANMLWLAPVFAVAAAALAPRERRLRVLLFVMLGYALPLAPWWYYKWRAFGSPGWDLTRLMVWEGVEGRSWFSLFHLPEQPVVPHGWEAVRLLTIKTIGRLPQLLLALATGPRALWAGALVLWLLICRPARPLAVAAWSILAATVLGLLAAAATIPWLRFLFPARIPLEAAGTLALWGLIAKAPPTMIGPRLARVLSVGVATLAIGWGVNQTLQGNAEARKTAALRGIPSALTLRDLNFRLRQELPPNEVVMSNLGPLLSWHSGRPVVHLALTPADVGACRRRLEFRHVLLAFRDAEQAWPGWQEVITRPEESLGQREWNVVRERHWEARDGFHIVWLELGPPEASIAGWRR